MINLILVFIILSYAIAAVIFSFKFLLKNRENLPKPDFKKRFDSLYQNVEYYKYHALANTSMFAARRLLLTFIIVFCADSIVLQILLADLLCTLLLAYYVTVVPMTSIFNNCIQVFNEAVVLILIWLLLQQTEYINDV